MSGAELLLLLPEIALLAGACLVLLVPAAAAWPLTAAALAAAAALTLGTAPAEPATALSGAFERAAALDSLRALICLLAGLALHYARGCGRADARLASNEFYALALFGCLGMFLLSAATHLIALYLGLEILALSLYPMVALARGDGRGAEAALKYFVLGALASGLLLYGLSLLYAATGTLHLETLGARLAPAPATASSAARRTRWDCAWGSAWKTKRACPSSRRTRTTSGTRESFTAGCSTAPWTTQWRTGCTCGAREPTPRVARFATTSPPSWVRSSAWLDARPAASGTWSRWRPRRLGPATAAWSPPPRPSS